MNFIKRCSIILLFAAASCGDDPVQNNQPVDTSGDIFYLKLNDLGGIFTADTYSINSDGTDNKLFNDSLVVTSASYNGKVALVHIGGGFYYDNLYVANVATKKLTHISSVNYYPVYFALSPRGDKVLFTTDAGNFLCVVNSDGTNFIVISTGISDEYAPQFSPDGDHIAYFESIPSVSTNLYIIKSDGTGKALIKDSVHTQYGSALDWSPDGNKIVFDNIDPFPSGICIINTDGTGYRRVAEGTTPDWSPDGTKICFLKYVNGATDVLSINPDGSGEINLTNTSAEYEGYCYWSPDSRKILYYHSNDNIPSDLRMYDFNSMSSGVLVDSATAGFWKY
ncbi:MAG: hypothetical protein ABI462_07485 [Ignavibacteria bacterium]